MAAATGGIPRQESSRHAADPRATQSGDVTATGHHAAGRFPVSSRPGKVVHVPPAALPGVGKTRGMTDAETVVIDNHVCGRPSIGYGGYVAGLLAARVGPTVKVDFRVPARTGRALDVVRSPEGGARLYDQAILVAEAAP